MTTEATTKATIEEYVTKTYTVYDMDWETGITTNPKPAESMEEARSMAHQICEDLFGIGNVITLGKDYGGVLDGKMQSSGATIKVEGA